LDDQLVIGIKLRGGLRRVHVEIALAQRLGFRREAHGGDLGFVDEDFPRGGVLHIDRRGQVVNQGAQQNPLALEGLLRLLALGDINRKSRHAGHCAVGRHQRAVVPLAGDDLAALGEVVIRALRGKTLCDYVAHDLIDLRSDALGNDQVRALADHLRGRIAEDALRRRVPIREAEYLVILEGRYRCATDMGAEFFL